MLKTNTVIIGGGLAGLTAAAYLARAGQQVTILEKSQTIGGRARTEIKHGFAFNFGPHALYRNADATPILRELGVEFSGGISDATGAYIIDHGKKHTLPGGFVSLLTTSFLPLPAKLEAARVLANFGKIDAAANAPLSVRAWLEQAIRHPSVRQLLQTLFRVATYAHDPELQSAGAAIKQFQLGLADGVYYLDGGWQTLVHGLRQAAEKAGARIQSAASVASLERRGDKWEIQLANGESAAASSVIIAASPADAATLVKGGEATMLGEWARAAIPVRAACLDIALAQLPAPHARFALGTDEPYYFSVHSAIAKLAPSNSAMIHVAKYLSADSSDDARAIEQELEGVLELMQPGWRELVIERRFLPRITVSHALVTAKQGGLTGRPMPAVPGLAGLYVAGDWVGHEGQLADASFASAKLAAAMILQTQARQPAAAA